MTWRGHDWHVVEESVQSCENYVAREKGQRRWAYVVHGHGTGKLIIGIRTWLKQQGRGKGVVAWRPGNEEEVGDAVTVLDLGKAKTE